MEEICSGISTACFIVSVIVWLFLALPPSTRLGEKGKPCAYPEKRCVCKTK
jgi:hypothetical protein